MAKGCFIVLQLTKIYLMNGLFVFHPLRGPMRECTNGHRLAPTARTIVARGNAPGTKAILPFR
jgi:hypothetical protein